MSFVQGSGWDSYVRAVIHKNPRVIYDTDWASENPTYQTLLHKFANRGERKCLCLILEAHKRNDSLSISGYPNYINWRDSGGRTALHHTAISGVPDCVDLLLKNGADPDVPDHDGKRPRDVIGLDPDTGAQGCPVDVGACQHLLLLHENT